MHICNDPARQNELKGFVQVEYMIRKGRHEWVSQETNAQEETLFSWRENISIGLYFCRSCPLRILFLG